MASALSCTLSNAPFFKFYPTVLFFSDYQPLVREKLLSGAQNENEQKCLFFVIFDPF